MFTKCPFCQQTYEIDQDLIGQNVRCESCGKEFLIHESVTVNDGKEEGIAPVTGNVAIGNKKKIVTLIVCGVLLVLLTTLFVSYKFILPAHITAKFEREFFNQLRDKVRDQESLKVEWKTACINKQHDMFLGICVVRAKNGMGGYADPETLKVCGKDENGKISFRFIKFTNSILIYENVDWQGFYNLESKNQNKLYGKMLGDVQNITSEMKFKLKKVPVPEKIDEGSDNYVTARARRIEHIDSILKIVEKATEKHLQWTLEGLKIIDERNFYSALFPDNKEKESELDKASKRLLSSIDDWTNKAANLRKEVEKADHIVAQKEMRLKVLAYLAVAAMVDDAILNYKKCHSGAMPSKKSVEFYEEYVRVQLGTLVKEYNNILELQQKIAKLPKKTSNRGKIELQELEQQLNKHMVQFQNTYDKLSIGILCDSYLYQCNKCISCKEFRFSPDHIKIDFRQPETAKLGPYFSSSRWNRKEIPSAEEVERYLAKNPEIIKQVCFGLPDTFVLLKKEDASKNAVEEKKDCVWDILTKNKEKIVWKNYRGLSTTCSYCNGRGEFSSLIPNPKYNPNRLGEAPDIRITQKCRYCHGAKRVKVFVHGKKASIAADLLGMLRANLSSEGGVFCDFSIGADYSKEMSGKTFYNGDRLLLVAPNSFGSTYYYSGNHKYNNVLLTVLVQNFGVLTQVKLYTADKQLINMFTEQAQPIPIFFQLEQSINKLPFSKKGKLLFPLEKNDETASENGYLPGEEIGSRSRGFTALEQGRCEIFVIYAVHPSVWRSQPNIVVGDPALPRKLIGRH